VSAWRQLTAEQAADLSAHLSEVLAGDELERAVWAIDFAAADADSAVTPGEWKRSKDATHEHMSKVAAAADALGCLLHEGRPMWKTAGLDWDLFGAALATIAESAQAEATMHRSAPGAGRPPDEWRDKLIAVICSVYPPGAALAQVEATVELVLGFLGRDVQDVHGLVAKSLRRRPNAPFVVVR